MKTIDVVLQLYAELPSKIDNFTQSVDIVSITSFGTTATVTTATDHGLSTGEFTTIFGAKNQTAIASMIRVDEVITVVTSIDHDLTLGFQETVDIQGAIESEFNGNFELLDVISRREFTIATEDSGPPAPTGSPVLVENTGYGFNGLFPVVVTGSDAFTYTLHNSLSDTAALGDIKATVGYRISASVSIDRAIAAYSAQATDEFWLFVVLGEVAASKNRHIENDSIESKTEGVEWRQKLLHPFSVYVIAPAIDSIAGRQQRDVMEDVSNALVGSLLGVKFDNGWAQKDQFQTVFSNHGFRNYNTAFYVHEFVFQAVSEITIDDTADKPFNIAFRDINLTIKSNIGAQSLVADISLDDVPL